MTGATGFVGRAVVDHLQRHGRVRAAVRQPCAQLLAQGVDCTEVGNLGVDTDWAPALTDVTSVVHTAARVHVMNEQAIDPLAAFRQVNVEGTLALARQCAALGVKRFVFISSVKVNGETTDGRAPFAPHEVPCPVDAYGISKWEAEEGLRDIERQTGMAVVVIRPPLIYGPGVKANFRRLIQAVARGWPLPLGGARNLRSLVALENLVSLIDCVLKHPAAAGEVFFASDGNDVSTCTLVRSLGTALGRHAWLLPIPGRWLMALAHVAGKGAVASRLLGSLQVDISSNKALLGWVPPVSMELALVRTVAGFKK